MGSLYLFVRNNNHRHVGCSEAAGRQVATKEKETAKLNLRDGIREHVILRRNSAHLREEVKRVPHLVDARRTTRAQSGVVHEAIRPNHSRSRWFVRSFVRLFVRSFVRSFVRAFVRSFI